MKIAQAHSLEKLCIALSKKGMQIVLFRKAQSYQLKQCLYPGPASAADLLAGAGWSSPGWDPTGHPQP